MGWRLKSAQFKLLSALPGGDCLYHLLQEHVTRSTVVTGARVGQKAAVGLDFWAWLQASARTKQLIEGRLLDFGAGWHPTIPLLWYALGNGRQTLVDIFPNMSAEKVNNTIKIFREVANEPDWPGRPWLRRLPESCVVAARHAGDALTHLGIEYRAPYGNLLRERSEQYDVVVCAQVMQHISQSSLGGVLQEIHSCLKPGGLLHATIHFVGQFGDPSSPRGRYEHLRYSPGDWERRINSRLMGFNRLKGPDYRQAIEQAGFKLCEFKPAAPTEADLAELRRTPVHSCFNCYPEQDLATLGVFLVAEKP